MVHDLLIQIAVYEYTKSQIGRLIPIVLGEFKYPMMDYLFRHLVGFSYCLMRKTCLYSVDDLYIPYKCGLFFSLKMMKVIFLP